VVAADIDRPPIELREPEPGFARRSASTIDAWLTVTSSRTPSAAITIPASRSPSSETSTSLI
jgi:hypothetical protein